MSKEHADSRDKAILIQRSENSWALANTEFTGDHLLVAASVIASAPPLSPPRRRYHLRLAAPVITSASPLR